MSEIVAKTYYHKNEPLFFYFLIFILFLLSMNLWIGWNGRGNYLDAMIGVLMAIYVAAHQQKLIIDKKVIISFIAVTLGHIIVYSSGLFTLLGFFLPALFILGLRDYYKIRCVHYLTKWFSLLMIPCILTYILYHTVGLPSLGTLVYDDQGVQSVNYLYRQNYLFYNYTDYYEIRFNGPFLEPGHLGMMSAFLLFADGFNFKKIDTWIICFAVILSMSLAGYMLVFIGYMFTQYERGKISLKYIVLILILIGSLYFIATYYNGGYNLLNEKIVSRLEPDEERGFSGNNRVFGDINLYFASLFTDRSLLLFGFDKNTIEYLSETGSRGTGFIMWMVKFGIVGTIAAALFYVMYMFLSKNKKYALLSLVFVILMFWQRSYPFWFSWIICYAYGITKNEYKISRLAKASQ